MQNFTTLIVDMVKQEKLFASQGGPIIIAQVYMQPRLNFTVTVTVKIFI